MQGFFFAVWLKTQNGKPSRLSRLPENVQKKAWTEPKMILALNQLMISPSNIGAFFTDSDSKDLGLGIVAHSRTTHGHWEYSLTTSGWLAIPQSVGWNGGDPLEDPTFMTPLSRWEVNRSVQVRGQNQQMHVMTGQFARDIGCRYSGPNGTHITQPSSTNVAAHSSFWNRVRITLNCRITFRSEE